MRSARLQNAVKPGDVIDNKYRIETQLGEGGMGRVLAATHLTLGSTIAIKLLKKDALSHPEVPRRFLREARAASRLRNEHVVRVSDVGQLPSGEPYMVMEMLHGYDLATRLRQGALEPPRAVEYIVQACEGLAEAHALGMVHRDIKPANLFVTTRPNNTPLIKVLDFGIATAAVGDVDHGLTTTQSVIGSPSYMSPEQLRATRDVDARSDIWSLGVTLYELLADRQPFIAPTITALSLKIVSDPHPPIDNIPDELMAIVDRCLAKDREARFADVTELAAALAPLFPNGKLAAEMVSGVYKQPVPPTVMDVSDTPDPASAGWRLPSAPQLTTTGFAAGESAAYAPSRRRKTWWIALGSALAAGIATAAVIKTTSHDESHAAPTGAVVQPAAPPVQPVDVAKPDPAEHVDHPAPTTTVGDPPGTTPDQVADPKPVDKPAGKPVDAKPVDVAKPDRPKRPHHKPRPDGPVTKPDVTNPVVITQPPPPPKDVPPPPIKDPPKKLPCAPSDKTCGL